MTFTKKYFQVTTFQLLTMAVLTGVVAAAIVIINIRINEYLQLPEVDFNSDGQCVSVANYQNGEAYQCTDVGLVLRNYRVKKKTQNDDVRNVPVLDLPPE
jgi:hypothetical protein